ncbi:hypothetical protein [Rhizobium tumorigenes]|uniref:Uncharacterized protein n=1 Tax=Rhizobium tumorigenes TaxID=2041385 RepID=A0AAF1K7Y8_9HYPH|nr:hypothetical protein [Rhizobium tumorigenes]WFR97490.1 hypothetical protein PR017_19920 [Rhizobium tumorigenes]
MTAGIFLTDDELDMLSDAELRSLRDMWIRAVEAENRKLNHDGPIDKVDTMICQAHKIARILEGRRNS